jgi:hypothetical protein
VGLSIFSWIIAHVSLEAEPGTAAPSVFLLHDSMEKDKRIIAVKLIAIPENFIWGIVK